ncbi:hypothetical protein GJ496_004184 [Pomphorhynchus laevis]|nr:hypothetical protein GJ496_004184 [Pomphorhynchus laevis]
MSEEKIKFEIKSEPCRKLSEIISELPLDSEDIVKRAKAFSNLSSYIEANHSTIESDQANFLIEFLISKLDHLIFIVPCLEGILVLIQKCTDEQILSVVLDVFLKKASSLLSKSIDVKLRKHFYAFILKRLWMEHRSSMNKHKYSLDQVIGILHALGNERNAEVLFLLLQCIQFVGNSIETELPISIFNLFSEFMNYTIEIGGDESNMITENHIKSLAICTWMVFGRKKHIVRIIEFLIENEEIEEAARVLVYGVNDLCEFELFQSVFKALCEQNSFEWMNMIISLLSVDREDHCIKLLSSLNYDDQNHIDCLLKCESNHVVL